MNNELYKERNHGLSLRITEIPPDGVSEILVCPYCTRGLPVGLIKYAKSSGVTTVCKRCKRTLSICTEQVAAEAR